MKYFSEIYGLVTDGDPVSENGQLFLTEYIFLSGSTEYNSLYNAQLLNSKVEKGLYHRNPLLTKRTMSHDNLVSIFAWSKQFKTSHRFEIWNYLLKHFGTYDNTKGRSEQFSKYLPFNPANFFVWGLAADSILAYLFLPFFVINLVLTCNKPKENTSGKILTWVELFPLQNNFICVLLNKYFTYKMKKMYGENWLKELMNIYHGNNSKEFPINKLYGE
jgi:hypothetical protein